MKDIDKLIKFDSWNELVTALDTEYTISIKQVCRIMKSSRNWVNRYITPNVHHIYIHGKSGNGPNFVRIAAKQLDKDMTESVWFNKRDFERYILSSVKNITKQTKTLKKTILMKPRSIPEYEKRVQEIKEQISVSKSPVHIISLARELRECFKDYLKPEFENLEFLDKAKRIKDRYPYVINELDMNKWIAVHDIKDYGDTDEEIYRMLYSEGYIRIEMEMIDCDGCVGNKIFYYPDEEYLGGTDNVIVSELQYQEIKKYI